MHFTLSICFVGIFVAGAFTSTELLNDIPKELLKRIFGNLNGLSYDIERQEVIELPSQTESVPIKFMNNNQPQIPLMISKVPAKEDAKEFSLINDPSKKNTLNENTAKVENLPKENTPEENVTLFDVRSDQIPNDDQTDK